MQILANGIISGLTLALLAVSFTTVYLPTGVFNLALAGIYTVVPFITWTCLQAGIPWYLAVTISVSLGIVLSLLCELANHAPLSRKGASTGAHLVSSLGIYILIAQSTAMMWGNETKVLRAGLDAVVTFQGIILTKSQIISLMVSLVCLAIFYLWLKLSKAGLQLQALADNPREFALKSYNVSFFRLTSFGISGFLCSVSCLLVAYDIGFDAHGGLSAVLLAVVAVVMGGRQSFFGPLLGALVLGLIRSEVVWIMSARWEEAVTFTILAAFLLLRPQGIMGQKMRLEASS